MKIYLLQVIDPEHAALENGYAPLGIAYVSAYLLQRMPDVDIIIRSQPDAKDVLKEKPDILGISCVTQNFDIAGKIAKEVQEKLGIPVIGGGEHVSCIKDDLPEGMSHSVLGEGEVGFYDLIKAYCDHGDLKPDRVRNIPGISYRDDDGGIKTTVPRSQMKNLDAEIPFPARHLLEGGSQMMFTSRGCPYKCKFCSSAAFWETIRFFSPERVIEEVRFLLDHHPETKSILIFDDLFAAKKDRIVEIADRMEAAGFSKRVGFWANSTANMINDTVAPALAKMGMDGISFGFESGNNEMVQWLKGKWTSVDTNRKAIAKCHEYGLEAHGSFMLGLPDETEKQMRETLHFIKTEKFDKGDICLCTPLPGTQFWTIGLERGLVKNHMDRWADLSLRYSGWFPDDNYILMTDKVPRRIFKEIFDECAYEMLKRTKAFDERRAEKYASRLSFGDFFKLNNIKRAIKAPDRARLYLTEYLKGKTRLGQTASQPNTCTA